MTDNYFFYNRQLNFYEPPKSTVPTVYACALNDLKLFVNP